MRLMKQEEFKRTIQERVFMRSSPELPIAPRGPYEYKDSSWFFDFRAVIFDARWLDCFAEIFWERFEKNYPFQVGGLESASIPLITAIILKGLEKKKPVHGFFIRKSRKRDGLMRMFEGSLTDHPVIIVDDALNSGQSVYREVLALLEMKKKITDIFVILAFRDPSSYTLMREHAIAISSIFTLQDFGLPLLPSHAPEIPRDSFEVKWRFAAGHPSFNFVLEKSAPAIDEKNVYTGSDDGFLYALEQATGNVAWKFGIGPHPQGKGVFSSPAIHKTDIYFGGYDGNVYALHTKDGSRKWTYAEADWIGSSPAIAPDLGLLFIGLEFSLSGLRGGIAALRLDTGARVWGARHRDFTHGTPLYVHGESLVVIGSGENLVHGYDARTGVLRWRFATRGDVKSSFAYDEKRQLILFGSWDGKMYALHATDGSLAFSFETSTPIFSTPLVIGDTAYMASLDKFLYAIDLDTGRLKWHFLTHGRIFSTPIIADGSLWIGSNDGRLYELDPKTGTLLSFHQCTERIVNAIAYNEKTERFFVPTVANEIYCIERKDKHNI
ncbi:hypothetical protein EXS56_01595 [Candidatus Kaiserbacteria bacterium]|nr:hypothetical protein [Candidatus Kaiserbacteria bacterium]